jgi:hypothetical protein
MSVRSLPAAALLFLVIVGTGAWADAADPPKEKVLFEENFTDAPGKGWSWYHEIRGRWKMDKERKALLISPVWAVGNLQNIPFREAPDVKESPIAIEVHINHEHKGDYEYGGLIWYFDDNNFVAIRKGPHGADGKIVSLVVRKAGKGDGPPSAPKNVIYNEPSVDVRLVVAGAKAQGWYRASSTEKWQSLGEVEMPSSGAAKIGLRTGNGEGGVVRFSKFRMLQLDR